VAVDGTAVGGTAVGGTAVGGTVVGGITAAVGAGAPQADRAITTSAITIDIFFKMFSF
jgi:hypothetical protein